MFKPLELFIGLRYTRAKRRNHFISFISLTSMLGVALGVAALITVLSVMNGFQKEVRSRILGMTAHASVMQLGGNMQNWQGLIEPLEGHSEVIGTAPYIRAEGMISHAGNVSGIMLRGILPDLEPKVSMVGDKMKFGQLTDLTPGSFNIVLGSALARRLMTRVGAKITVVAPQPTRTPAGILPRFKRFNVVGIFEVGMHEYDSAVALIHLQDAQKLFRYDDGDVTGIRLKLKEVFDAPAVSDQIVRELPGIYGVVDWTKYHSNLFRALRTEKTVMFIILLMIVGVAAFNIVSTLVMVVTDKEADIAILRTLGLTPLGVMGVFMVQGTIVGIVGTLLGLIGGVWLALNVETIVPALESYFQTQFLPSDVYYISELPSDLQWDDVVTVSIIAFLLSLLATLYPAWRASKVQPAEALRYE